MKFTQCVLDIFRGSSSRRARKHHPRNRVSMRGFEQLETRDLLSVPATPQLLVANATSPSTVELNWADVSGETGYKLFYKLDGTSDWRQGTTAGRDATRGTISGLNSNTRYVFDVQAYNGEGGSPFSNQKTLTMPVNVPAAPNLQSATATSLTTAKLVWGNVSGEDGYKLFYKLDGTSDWKQGSTVGRDATEGTISGLTAGTRYVFDVQAYNGTGGSPFSNQITLTMPVASGPVNNNLTNVTVPNAPSNVTGTATSATQVKLSWVDNSNNETGFQIKRWNGSAWAQIGTVGPNVTTYTDTGLSPSTTYYYEVVAYNSAGTAWAASYATVRPRRRLLRSRPLRRM